MLWVRVCVCYVYKWGKLENLDRWLQTIESPMCYLKKNHDKNAGLYFGPVFNPVHKNKC
jgi:hypothetical protein